MTRILGVNRSVGAIGDVSALNTGGLVEGASLSDHQHQYAQEPFNLVYIGSWTTFPTGGIARCYKVGNFVQFDGIVKSTGADRTLFQVPFEFRPDPRRLPLAFTTWSLDTLGGTQTHLIMDTSGYMSADNLGWTPAAPVDYLTLTGIRYIFK